ncbi:hypothetical protein U8P80_20030 [Rhizobium beringeri]|jgi:hypothetical protein|nr:hypothetical protein U8P80_20030 [Rhizobium beringeri]WSH13869.1 hypothetical protein U8P74_20030 [Rhizobium beringeri]
MKQKLTERQKTILTCVLNEKDASLWIAAIQAGNLSFEQIEEACDLLSGAFHMNGIDENFEPNDYGKEIEALIDVVNRPRLK